MKQNTTTSLKEEKDELTGEAWVAALPPVKLGFSLVISPLWT